MIYILYIDYVFSIGYYKFYNIIFFINYAVKKKERIRKY